MHANRAAPQLVETVHRDYVEAGAHLLTANTFGASRFTCGDADSAVQLVQTGIRLARRAAFGRALVFGSISPLGPVFGAEIDQESASNAFAEIAQAMADTGADGIIVETMLSNAEAVCAVRAVHAVCSLPVLVSRPLHADRLDGIDDFVASMEPLGVAALGVNCVSGLRELLPVVERLCQRASVPVLVRPNAGYPSFEADGPRYHLRPDYFLHQARAYAAAGAQLIGGCCGTGPEHIAVLAAASEQLQPAQRRKPATPVPPPEAPQAERPWLHHLHHGELPVLALLPPGLGMLAARDTAGELAGAGVVGIGLQESEAAPHPQPARLRHLQDATGAAGVLTLNAGSPLRDAQEQLLAAHLLGLPVVLIDAGVIAAASDGIAAAERLVRLCAGLNRGRDVAGNRLPEATAFTIGVRLRADQLHAAADLATAGADVATLQPVYEPAHLRALMADWQEPLPLIAEILILPDAETAEAVDNEMPNLQVPERLKARLRQDPEEDRRGVLRFLRHWRKRLAGVCLLLPDARSDAARAVLAALQER
ncbi:MAG: homocysteine S-methyltransferase family protein [Planctomycetota bacterium]